MAANFPQVKSVNLVCDNSHTHEAWGKVAVQDKKVFATSLEVHYPTKLCDALAQSFLCRLEQQFNFAPSDFPKNSDFKAATFVQPKGSKAPSLFSPFESKFLVLLDRDGKVCWPLNHTPTKSAKLLHEFLLGESEHEGVTVLVNKDSVKSAHDRVKSVAKDAGIDINLPINLFPCSAQYVKVFGVPLSPKDFVQKAMQVEHPMSVESCLPDILHEAVSFLAETSDLEVMTLRTTFIKKWLCRANELRKDEAEMRSRMDQSVAKVTEQKRILLFGEILRDLNYPDMQVVDELRFGVSLVGEVPVTNMLPQKRTPPLLTEDSLKSRSTMVRPSVRSSVGPSGDDELDASIWEQTLDEVPKGSLVGPLSDGDVPLDAPISRRFGVRQKSKIRPVDDFSASGVDKAAGVSESPALHTVDVIGSMLVDWLRCNRELQKSSETVLRTYDLKSAYRQIGLDEEGRAVAYIVVFDPNTNQGELFQCRALPFGAVRSVHSFLRLARAVWFVGVVGCKLAWSSFFDDFLVAARPSLANNTDMTVVSLFKLLGWEFAESGKKCVPFGKVTEVLGVCINASPSSDRQHSSHQH